ncbi:CPBP family intramembrane glutamic endopeptidase [Raineyella sp. LH-20]|uniref:CPBP family intramembrane glutamic endopeptidase n=1 Tax=Raineyella sp. LH-20 TaxID=3081204 RepID=UPI002954DE72|nr:CPBP family intramembrane glutamic endopeptidase [Raineyella sp. LH-20]WOP19720.1 CPBP family intramembrane glutamic endopeptidase [Raineyella sp. LH-20]
MATVLVAASRRRRPWLFLVLVMVLVLPLWWATVATGGRALVLGLPVAVVGIVIPAALASVLAWREEGWTGLHAVWSGLVDVARVRPRWWWTVGLGAAPVAAALGWLIGPRPGDAPAVPWYLTPLLFVVFFLGAIPEEVGWTGYLTARLTADHGVLGAGVIIGAAWQLWHSVPYLAQGHTWSWLAGQFLVSVLARILMVLLYRHSGGGLALACAVHAMLNTVQIYPDGFAAFDPWPSVPGMLLVLLGAAWLARRTTRS